MMNPNKQEHSKGSSLGLGKQRSYAEIIETLDNRWQLAPDKSLSRIKKIDSILGFPSKKFPSVFVAGTNGKSLTINFISQILKEEGISAGTYSWPHFLTYNERISLNNNETINNKVFTEIANEILNTIETENIEANTQEILTAISLKYFEQSKVDVAIFEVAKNHAWDPVNVCEPKVVAITRVTDNESDQSKLDALIDQISNIVVKDSWVISADQSKISLHKLQEKVYAKQANWAMPIRKLAPLSYPFEQLHGRSAALAERVAQIFIENWITKEATVISDSLLIRPKGQRGRPTIEAKRKAELNPQKTLEQFWKDTNCSCHGHFQLLDKEKPSILLDASSNLDSLENLLLGTRLLNYKKPFKGLTIVYNYENDTIESSEFLKQIRYFFKKTPGQLIISPAKISKWKIPVSIDANKILNNLKNSKIKVVLAQNFLDALDKAKKSVDERNGLVVITGGPSAITEYWLSKDIKKF